MTLIKNALVVTMNSHDTIIKTDILIRDGKITGLGKYRGAREEIIDARGMVVFPGFIQSHLHLNQTLFRNLVDDMPLLKWLRRNIWPMEAAHNPRSIRAAARLALSELMLSGTTTFVSMETVHHTGEVFKQIADSGLRGISGKAMMDAGRGVPVQLKQKPVDALQESVDLLEKWHGYDDGRIQYAFAPRFAVSSSRRLLEETARLAREYKVRVHTHAAETREEVLLVQQRFGTTNIQLFDRVGLLESPLIIAHGIYLTVTERKLLRQHKALLAHCPSTNLKLGSGIADIPGFQKEKLQVGLGADGAGCNNNLSILQEMRLAALIQKPKNGPQSMPALKVVSMATREAAKALGMDKQVGSIEVGKDADLAIFDFNTVETTPGNDPCSQLVYSAGPKNLRHLLVRGRTLVQNGELTGWEQERVVREAQDQARKLLQRL
jgi:5-methylthioadenosine/S-adenosylhomocysteine deaminase